MPWSDCQKNLTRVKMLRLQTLMTQNNSAAVTSSNLNTTMRDWHAYHTRSYHMSAGLVQQSYTKSYKRLLGTKCLQRPPWWKQRVFTLTGVDEDVCAVITFRDRAKLHSSIRTVSNLWNAVVVVSWLIQSFPMAKRWWVLEKENTSCSFLKEEKSHRTD